MATGMECVDRAQLQAYARSELSAATLAGLESHLAMCPKCLQHAVEVGKRKSAPNVPNCHVVKEIGRGRFGVVYKAWWLVEAPRIVALKILSYAGKMERERFDREIAVLQRLDCPYIVKCHESGATGDARYFVMDYVDGVHLDEYCHSSKHKLNANLATFQRICQAVAEAHAHGVIHRDLKPRNILIDKGGDPHVLDFGICAVENTDWTSWHQHTITRAGDVIGTVKYMSPEQAWGGVNRAIDERTDIWSLGIMLHEVSTGGDYPYSLRSTPDRPPPEALLERIRRELPDRPRLGHLPQGKSLEILLDRCLVWEPDRRLDSAQQLADDLGRIGKSEPITTKPLWIPYRLERFAIAHATRSRWTFLGAFIALHLLVLSACISIFGVGWRVTGHNYEGLTDGVDEFVSPAKVRDDIRIVGVFDDTAEAVIAWARREGLPGVGSDVKTWREVHGRMMQRLARTKRPQAVAWDYYFNTPGKGDEALAEGLLALERAGTPVILSALMYDGAGVPDLSPTLLRLIGEGLRHGTITGRDSIKHPGELVIATKLESGATVPSLSLATLAAILHPETRLDVAWASRNSPVQLYYAIGSNAYLRERDEIDPTRPIKASIPESRLDEGEEDLKKPHATAIFELDSPQAWLRRTIPYEQLLMSSDQQLASLVGEKILIVGDLRTTKTRPFPDRHAVRYGTKTIDDVPGVFLHGDALAGLLGHRYLRAASLLDPDTFLTLLIVAALGCLVPIWLATLKPIERPLPRRLLWGCVLAATVAFGVAMLLAERRWTVHLAMGGFSLFAPMTGALWVELIRNRHRMLESDRRAIDRQNASANRTVTLASRR